MRPELSFNVDGRRISGITLKLDGEMEELSLGISLIFKPGHGEEILVAPSTLALTINTPENHGIVALRNPKNEEGQVIYASNIFLKVRRSWFIRGCFAMISADYPGGDKFLIRRRQLEKRFIFAKQVEKEEWIESEGCSTQLILILER